MTQDEPDEMASIAIIDGAKIFVYGNDHGRPLLLVLYAKYRIVIENLEVLAGELPKLRKVLDWAASTLLGVARVTSGLRAPSRSS